MAILASENWNIADGQPWPSTAGSLGNLGLNPTSGGGGASVLSGRGILTTGNGTGYLGTKRCSRRAVITAPANAVWDTQVIFNGSEVYPRLYVRSTSSLIDGAGGYFVEFTPNIGGWSISYAVAFVGPPGGLPLRSGSFSFTPGVIYRLIFGAVGPDIKMQLYPMDQPQPTAWTAELTNSVITAAGSAGMTVGAGNAPNTSLAFDNAQLLDTFPVLPSSLGIIRKASVPVGGPAAGNVPVGGPQ